MAAPETQFGQAGIQIPGFQGYQYHPQAVNVPTGAGALWAQAGQTALEAGKQIQQSPLNPLVRAQMKEGIARAQEGVNYLDQLGKSPYGMMFGGEGPEGFYARAPVEAGAQWAPYVLPKPQEASNAPAAPATPAIAPHTGPEKPAPEASKPVEPSKPAQAPKYDKDNLPKNLEDVAQAPAPATNIAANTAAQPPAAPGGAYSPEQLRQMVAGTTIAGGAQPAQMSASAGPGAVPQQTQPVQRPLSGPQGAPQGMFLNPATGSYEPMQNQPPPAPAGATQPAAAQPSTPGTVPGSLSDQYAQQQAAAQKQQDLTNWQNTTQTEPMTADDAMKYIRRKTTLAQDATYLPHGGPNNEPAFAFHMKGGGINTIPLSQMVQDGAGPTVAAQNTSAVLSQTDRLKQQQQNALVTAPPTPTDQTGQPTQQPAQGGQVWNPQQPAPAQPQPQGPPPAPGQYPEIASDQGGQEGAPGTSYDPHPYRQMIAEITRNPQNLTASIQPSAEAATPANPSGDKVTPLTKEQQAAVDGTDINKLEADAKNAPADPNGGDPHVGDLGVLGPLYRDDRNKTGRLYALLPADNYRVQKYYLGSDGFKDYDLPDTRQRQQLEAEYGNTQKGGVGGVKVSDKFTFPSYTHDEIENMPIEKVNHLLDLANQWHTTNSTDSSSSKSQILANLAEQSRTVQRIMDGVQMARQEKIDPRSYDTGSQGLSEEAGKAKGLEPEGGWTGPWWQAPPNQWLSRFGKDIMEEPNYLQAAWHGFRAQGKEVMPLADEFHQEMQHLVSSMKDLGKLPTQQYTSTPEGEKKSQQIGFGFKGFYGTTKIDLPSELTSINELNKAFQGGDQTAAWNLLKTFKSRIDDQFEREYADGITHNYRPNGVDVVNHHAITNKVALPDSPVLNKFRNAEGQLQNPYAKPSVSTAASPAPSPKPTPDIVTQEQAKAAPVGRENAGPGEIYRDVDGLLKRKPK